MVLNIVGHLQVSSTHVSFILDTEIHPQIIENPKIYPDVEDNRLVFKCEFNSSTVEDVARFYVSWFEEFPLEQLNKLDILKGTERIARLEVSLNSSHDGPQFKLGKTVSLIIFWFLNILHFS